QVVLVTAGTVGVAADLDHGGLVFLQYFRYGVECRLEGFLDVRLVGIEGNVARHIENDVVSVTGHRYTGRFQFLAQLGFLYIHVVADTAAGNRTDTGTFKRALLAFLGVVRSSNTDDGADVRTDGSATGGLGGLLLAGVGVIGGTATGHNCCCNQCTADDFFHWRLPSIVMTVAVLADMRQDYRRYPMVSKALHPIFTKSNRQRLFWLYMECAAGRRASRAHPLPNMSLDWRTTCG